VLLLLFKSRRAPTVTPPGEVPRAEGGFIGVAQRHDEGRRRRVRPRQIEPWQTEHENDAALIAAGII
jgi:hypothetical protein